MISTPLLLLVITLVVGQHSLVLAGHEAGFGGGFGGGFIGSFGGSLGGPGAQVDPIGGVLNALNPVTKPLVGAVGSLSSGFGLSVPNSVANGISTGLAAATGLQGLTNAIAKNAGDSNAVSNSLSYNGLNGLKPAQSFLATGSPGASAASATGLNSLTGASSANLRNSPEFNFGINRLTSAGTTMAATSAANTVNRARYGSRGTVALESTRDALAREGTLATGGYGAAKAAAAAVAGESASNSLRRASVADSIATTAGLMGGAGAVDAVSQLGGAVGFANRLEKARAFNSANQLNTAGALGAATSAGALGAASSLGSLNSARALGVANQMNTAGAIGAASQLNRANTLGVASQLNSASTFGATEQLDAGAGAVGLANQINRARAFNSASQFGAAGAVGAANQIKRAGALGIANAAEAANQMSNGVFGSANSAYGASNQVNVANTLATANQINRASSFGLANSAEALGTVNQLNRASELGAANQMYGAGVRAAANLAGAYGASNAADAFNTLNSVSAVGAQGAMSPYASSLGGFNSINSANSLSSSSLAAAAEAPAPVAAALGSTAAGVAAPLALAGSAPLATGLATNRAALAGDAVSNAVAESAIAGADMNAHSANNARGASLASNAYRQAKLATARDMINIAGTVQNSARISDAAIATHDAATKAEDSLLGSELAIDSAATVLDSDATYIPPVTNSLLRSLPYGRLGIRNILPKPLTYPSILLPDVWLNGQPVNYFNVPFRMLPYGYTSANINNFVGNVSPAYYGSGLAYNGQPFYSNNGLPINELLVDPQLAYQMNINGVIGSSILPVLANGQLEAQDEIALANSVTNQQLAGQGMAGTYYGFGRVNPVPMLTGKVNQINLAPTTTIGTTYPIGSALVIEPRDSYFQDYIDNASSRQNFDERQQ